LLDEDASLSGALCHAWSVRRPLPTLASAPLSDRCRAGCRLYGVKPTEEPRPSLANECSVP
jgi:hypothetical protein